MALRMALRLTRRSADALVSLALDLAERLPAVQAAMTAGEIDRARAWVLVNETTMLAQDEARRVVAKVLGSAPGLTTTQLARKVRRLVLATDPSAARRRQARSLTERRLVAETDPQHTATLAGYQLPVERTAQAYARIDAIAASAHRCGDERTLDQLRADTFLDLLLGVAPATGPSDDDAGDARAGGADTTTTAPAKGSVEVTVPLTTLLDLSEEPGDLAGWGPILADTARQIAADQHDARWGLSVHDAAGRLIHHNRLRRHPTVAEAAFVRARDRTCRAPGCRNPASRSDLDHTRPWADGGPTSRDNLGALCRHHHRLKHEGRWRLRQTGDGTFVWLSPLEQTYITPPEPPMRT
jgi:hypothetical protein